MRNACRLFGAEIQYFRLEPRYWEEIVRRLKDAGLPTVTSYVSWGAHVVGEPDERNPAGVLDFDGRTNPRLNLHRFLELVEKHGLDLNFRCGPFCCNEQIWGGYPRWLVLGDPAMMVWDYQNRTTQGYWIAKKEGSQPSYLHPEYLAWCRKWFDQVDPIIRKHLKKNGGCVTLVNLDNEVSYIVRDSFLDSDYNPVNVRPGGFWHRFLAEKYKDAAGLPYDTRYAGLEAVPPPRAVPENITRDLAWYLDWVEFKEWAMSRYLAELRRMHEQNGVDDVTFMTNFNPHLPEGIPTRMPSFERAVRGAKGNGIAGYDFYRGTFLSYSGYHSMARVLKLMNASLSLTWSAEFMSGTWEKILSSRVSDDHMRFMARCALAHGCKAIAWFMFHDRDCWNDAPVSSHGHARPSLEVLRETVELASKRIPHWDSLKPCGDVAIVYDLVQHRHTSIGDPMPCNDQDIHVGAPCVAGVKAGLASREYAGLFRLVEEAGVQADAVDIMHDSSALARYPLVLLPGSPVIESLSDAALRAYVENGGTLLVSGPLPSVDEAGRPLRFLGIAAPAGATPCTRIPVGKGTLVWCPAYLAQEEPEAESLDSIAAVTQLVDACVKKPHVRIRPAQDVSWVQWKKEGGSEVFRQPRNLGSAVLHTGGGNAVLFVLNHYPEAMRFQVELAHCTAGVSPAVGRASRPPATWTLRHVFSGDSVPLRGGKAELDIDRKACDIYEVIP